MEFSIFSYFPVSGGFWNSLCFDCGGVGDGCVLVIARAATEFEAKRSRSKKENAPWRVNKLARARATRILSCAFVLSFLEYL